MADGFAKVRPAQPLRIPAAAYNAFVDAAKAHRGVREDALRDVRREQTQALVPIKNTSGATIPRLGVLGVDGPLFLPSDAPESFKRRTALTGSAPAEGTHEGRFVIALEPIPPGALGMACAAGLCAVQVEFPPDVPGGVRERRFADIAGGVTGNLKAGDLGAATIIWREPGAGVKWAIVRLGGLAESRLFPVKLTVAGGQQGYVLAEASWTYDVADAITDEVLAQGVDPTADPHRWVRPSVGQVTPATYGSAHYDDEGALVLGWINEMPQPGWAFPIILTQAGGQQGTPSMPATWQYGVFDAISGFTLATGVDPAAPPHGWKRPAAGKVTPATFGYATLSSGGVLTIGWINEVPETHPMPVFPVLMILAELSYGDAKNPTTHMYNVFDLASGEEIGTFIDPGAAPHQWKRPSIGRLEPGTLGLAFRNASDDVIITWVNEALALEACAASMGA